MDDEPENKSNKQKIYLLIAGIVIISFISALVINSAEKPIPELDPLLEGLGVELNDQGWTLYTKSDCSWCIEQEEILGDEYKHITKIELGTRDLENAFSDGTIEGLPTWYNWYADITIMGCQQPEELWNMTRMASEELE